MTRVTFEQLVEEGFLAIPERFRQRVNNVAILVENEPSLAVRREQGLRAHQTLLGLYRGVPHTGRGSNYGVGMTLPDTITIYQKPIEAAAQGDPDRVREIVRDTIWHEIAHHFGMNEARVRHNEVRRRRLQKN
jgi:predicted Zn-dependent protease with MMP-like domain